MIYKSTGRKEDTPDQEDMRNIAVPAHGATVGSALDYHSVAIDLTDRISQEPLVDVSTCDLASESYYARQDRLNAPYYRQFSTALKQVFVRRTVAEKLIEANRSLHAYNAEVLLLDGFRPITLQQQLWTHFIEQARLTLVKPTDEQCVRFAGTYCSNPENYNKDDWRTWPTHNTGGAIDLTLRSKITGEHLFFGGVFDDASELSFTAHFEQESSMMQSASFIEARRNRRLLYWAMTGAGFANYPNEWWHYDFGTQMWVANSPAGDRKAVYDRAELP